MLLISRQVVSRLRLHLVARHPSATAISKVFYSPSARERQHDSPNDDPVRFSGSRADFDAASSFQPVVSNAPRYQPLCVMLSLAAFLIYFCILREENDVDTYLGRNVYTYMDPYGEAALLRQKLKQQKRDGIDTRETEEKLDYVMNIIAAKQGNNESLDASLKRIEQAKKDKKSFVDMK